MCLVQAGYSYHKAAGVFYKNTLGIFDW